MPEILYRVSRKESAKRRKMVSGSKYLKEYCGEDNENKKITKIALGDMMILVNMDSLYTY